MKVLVFGAGALGSLLGAHLARRYHVRLVGRAPHMEAVAARGLRVTGAQAFTATVDASLEAPPHWMPDLILVTVKTLDLGGAIEGLEGRLGPRTVLLTLQNGLGNWERLSAAFPDRSVLAGSIVYGARLAAPGHVVASGTPDVTVGGAPADLPAAEAVAEVLTHADLPTRAVSDVRGTLLAKALVNCVINPLTALAGAPNGVLLTDALLRRRAQVLAAEGQRILDAVDHEVPVRDLWAAVERVATNTAPNRSSMLQDIDRGRPTEADAILGQVRRLAGGLGIPTPALDQVHQELAQLEARRVRRVRPTP